MYGRLESGYSGVLYAFGRVVFARISIVEYFVMYGNVWTVKFEDLMSQVGDLWTEHIGDHTRD